MNGVANFVVGLQYGDEGKGKIVDLLAAKHSVVVRANGGANAGHTIILSNDTKLALHQLPSGVAYPNTVNVIAHGVFLDPERLRQEIDEAEAALGHSLSAEQLAISTTAHLVLPIHKAQDGARESGGGAQGSTKAGIAFVASAKAQREGVRAEVIFSGRQQLVNVALNGLTEYMSSQEAQIAAEEFADAALLLQPYLKDTVSLLQDKITDSHNVMVEGAQAFGLDINHGKYPYTTSSDTTVPGLLVGSGINHTQVGQVIGVVKAIPSKVGGGVFVTKIDDAGVAESTRGQKGQVDAEYGATTGREREVGYLDLVNLKRAVQVNGVDAIALTKFDCLNRHGEVTKIAIAYSYMSAGSVQTITTPPASHSELLKCTPIYEDFAIWGDISSLDQYDQLPEAAKKYLERIEDYLGIPVTIIGTGPGRNQIILR